MSALQAGLSPANLAACIAKGRVSGGALHIGSEDWRALRAIHEPEPSLPPAPAMPPVRRELLARAFALRQPETSPLAAVPREQWPAWAERMARLKQPGEAGVGDTIERLLGLVGRGYRAAFLSLTGHDCGCAQRQSAWNKIYAYDDPARLKV